MSDHSDRDIHGVLESLPQQPSAAHDDAIRKAADQLLPNRPRRRRPAIWAAIALAASVLLAVALPSLIGQREPTDATRGQGIAVVPASNARLDAPPAYFQWPPVVGARGYRVILRDESAEVLWTGEVHDAARLALPAAAHGLLASSPSFVWSVQVLGSREDNELGPFWFHVDSD